LIFEIGVGIYFPIIGTLKSTHIPEESRSAVMNLFRLPLNILVVVVLKWIHLFENDTIFFICSIWLLISIAAIQFGVRPKNRKNE